LLKAVAFAFFSLVAVSSAVHASSGSVLTIANFRDLRDLNPHQYSGELFAQNLLFEGLVFLDEQGKPSPWLAKSWSVSKDGTTYTFELRDDVSFTDGVKFDASVVKKNFDALLDNAKRHGWLESIRLMQEQEAKGDPAVKVLGDYRVQVKFTKPYYPFLIELGVTRPFRMLSPKCFVNGTTKNGVSCLVGTASYVLESNAVDQQSVFVRNPSYWGEKPAIEKIVAKVIPDEQARVVALQKGDIDMVFGLQMVSPRVFKQFESKPGFAAAMSKPMSTRMLILNSSREHLKDTGVRQALNHLTNRAVISDKIMLGLEAPADTLLSRSTPYANIDLKPYAYDPALAVKLLEQAGWKMDGGRLAKNGKPFELTLSYDSNKVVERTVAQYLQSEWGKSGIKLNLVSEEEQAHRDRLKQGDFDLSFNISWGTPYDPQSFLAGMRNPAVYGDYVGQQGLKDKAKIDATILAALESVDEKSRQASFTYVLETLHNEAAYIPLTYERNRVLYNSSKVKKIAFNPSQFEIPVQRMRID
jgi:nickel transport system substrate-binding protein